MEILKASPKLFADETTCPVLDPGRGRTKTGYLWAIARDDRPWQGIGQGTRQGIGGSSDPPAVAYMYAPGRGTEHALRLLAGFSGILQVDSYAVYKKLGSEVTLALCWNHFRRKFYDLAKGGNAPIATEALKRIGQLYRLEADIRGNEPDVRRTARKERAKPIIDDLKPWLEENLMRVSGRSPIAEAIRYGLTRWNDLSRYLDDGRIEIDTNTVERALADRTEPQERTLRRLRQRRRQLGRHRIAYRNLQAQQREPTRLAQRYPDQTRQPLAAKPDR